jgi:hypothetical protein
MRPASKISTATLIVTFLAGVGLGALLIWRARPPGRYENIQAVPSGASVSAISPPWGLLEAVEMPFADPDALFSDRAVRLEQQPWFFETSSQSNLIYVLSHSSLTEAQKQNLFQGAEWRMATNGYLVTPSLDLVRGLSPSSRQQIYSLLARSPINYSQRYPFRFRPDTFEARFAAADLSPAKMNLLRSLMYTNDGDLCFSDLNLLPSNLSTSEFNEVVNVLYRLPVYLLRLRIFEHSSIEGITKYWGVGGREKRIKPLLDSLARVGGINGTTLNVSYLLPAFPRLRLYTFPNAWTNTRSAREDCFWTALNFFNNQPDNRFLDPDNVRESLRTEFAPVNDHPSFGDVVTLWDSQDNIIHACIYLAEDFVFTKNGNNPLAPWVIMRIPDMLLLFPSEKNRTRIFRKLNANAKL